VVEWSEHQTTGATHISWMSLLTSCGINLTIRFQRGGKTHIL
jgi:hypothetical protein